MLTITQLIDEAKCYEIIRHIRWPQGVACPKCGSSKVTKRGKPDSQPAQQRYRCHDCRGQFDDLSGTILAHRHQSLKVWVSCLYLMGLNLSNQQIAQELNLNKDDVQKMTTKLRQGIVDKKPQPQLSGEVECDEVYITAGHKGRPDIVKKKAAKGGGANSKGFGVEGHSKRKSHQSLA